MEHIARDTLYRLDRDIMKLIPYFRFPHRARIKDIIKGEVSEEKILEFIIFSIDKTYSRIKEKSSGENPSRLLFSERSISKLILQIRKDTGEFNMKHLVSKIATYFRTPLTQESRNLIYGPDSKYNTS